VQFALSETPRTGVGTKKSENLWWQNREEGMIDVAAGEKRSGHETS